MSAGSREELFQNIKNNQPKLEGAIPLVIACFSTLNEDAICDDNVEAWYASLLKNMKDSHFTSGNAEFSVPVATSVMFSALRVGVKKGEISTLLVDISGERYDSVLPNGKILGNEMPDEPLNIHRKYLMELL